MAGRPAHLNGTITDFANKNTDLIFEGSQYPYGFVINMYNKSSQPIEINAGSGTRGIYLYRGHVRYNDPPADGFYGMCTLILVIRPPEAFERLITVACNNTLLYGPALQLFYKPRPLCIPRACSAVRLRAVFGTSSA